MTLQTNHYAVQVDGMTMASGPGAPDHAEGMRAIYADINPGAEVTVILSRCDENPYGPCAAHAGDFTTTEAVVDGEMVEVIVPTSELYR